MDSIRKDDGLEYFVNAELMIRRIYTIKSYCVK